MHRTSRARAMQSILAMTLLFGMGGGCVAIYGFDDFEKKAPPACKTLADCPSNNECGNYVCDAEVCIVPTPVEAGKLTTNNKRGDCARSICDGKGNAVVEIDDTDVPYDANDCTNDICANGVPSNPQAPTGTGCGTSPNVKCNTAGACVGCQDVSDCGIDNKCSKWSCENKQCIRTLEIVGSVVDNANQGDCRAIVCNAVGEEEEVVVNFDIPSDGNDCTTDACTTEGLADHQPTSIDTPCGNCGLCAANGVCMACDLNAFDCYQNVCYAKSKPCTTANDCPSMNCVTVPAMNKSFCCDTPCAAPCMACSNDKTGAPDGVCAPVLDQSDPYNNCIMPPSDVCVQGQCRCHNGVQDLGETGVDCGGTCDACSGKWSCGGATACGGTGASAECCEFADCVNCNDQSADCATLEGQTCALGAAPKKLTLGLLFFQFGCPNTSTACKTITCNCVP